MSISAAATAAAAIAEQDRGPEADRVVRAADHVRAEQQQRALREVDDAGGA